MDQNIVYLQTRNKGQKASTKTIILMAILFRAMMAVFVHNIISEALECMCMLILRYFVHVFNFYVKFLVKKLLKSETQIYKLKQISNLCTIVRNQLSACVWYVINVAF